jgi:hypothetical protein
MKKIVDEACHLGANRYIRKPVDFGYFVVEVRQIAI